VNQAETLLKIHLTEEKIPFETEVELVDNRKFRWDFVIGKLAVEIQGGIWRKKGAHNTGSAIMRDCVKCRLAVNAGYIPVFFVTSEVLDGTAIKWIKNYREHRWDFVAGQSLFVI